MMLIVANGQPQFHTFVDRCGLPEPRRSNCRKLGFLRMWQPRPFISTFVVPMADVRNARLRLNHALAEMVLRNSGGQHVPAWILEAVGMDANLTFAGRPGPLCVVYEDHKAPNLIERWAVSAAHRLVEHYERLSSAGVA